MGAVDDRSYWRNDIRIGRRSSWMHWTWKRVKSSQLSGTVAPDIYCWFDINLVKWNKRGYEKKAWRYPKQFRTPSWTIGSLVAIYWAENMAIVSLIFPLVHDSRMHHPKKLWPSANIEPYVAILMHRPSQRCLMRQMDPIGAKWRFSKSLLW